MDRSSAGGVVVVATLALVLPAGVAAAPGPPSDPSPPDDRDGSVDDTTPALATPYALVDDRDVDDRRRQPEDRYALAGGCYTIEAPGTGHVARSGDGLVLAPDRDAAEPFHFQATRLGRYLVAANAGRSTEVPDAWWDDRGYLAAAGLLPELPLDQLAGGLPLPGDGLVDEAVPAMPTTSRVTVASEPGDPADWRVAAAGDDPDARARGSRGQAYTMSLPSEGTALAVVDGALTLTEGTGDGFRFHHVPDDDPSDDDPNGAACATWPEIPTNTSGPPEPARGNPAGEVTGFFEAHIHGMAFEFLGGELRCGRPWHPYGVEHALPNCREDGKLGNAATEVVLAGTDPSSYDPVGWPTFSSWPHHDLLTHEQWYWRWLQRAHHGGLRLLTNLFVENTALCQAYPLKRNSCNEMDSVRLQARRLFELQDYVDAQSGGPGEGWFRIVTSPAQAREVINDGRLAVVMGIEVSILFDCGEVMGQPRCTREDIDQRVAEVHDMGIRQVELINKFDNALSGVTGDSGSTGVIVNQGNRSTTGHYWDMRSCPPSADDGHGQHVHGTQYDKTQPNAADDTPLGEGPGRDVLAAEILQQFGGLTSTVAPAYPPAPHCNALGLTDLGRHAVRRIVEHGILFDPDHMSAKGQRQALDLVEEELVPAEHVAAEARGRPPVVPGLVSSHSWANDVTYQRILQLGGHVAPMQSDASSFADRWAQRRRWAQRLAPDDRGFGMGFGADTNGFASQPDPADEVDVAYDGDGWQAPIGGVTVFQQTSGTRTYDIDADGVAHYGLYADWFRELALAADQQHAELGGGDALTADMLRGAEHYLQTWERATYGGNDCVTDHSTFQPEDLHALLGANAEGFLRAVGQPVDRDGAAYTYCVAGDDGTEVVDVVFDEDGRAQRIRPSDADVTPAPATSAAGSGAAGHGHASAQRPLPATGGGLAGAGLLLLGLTAAGSRVAGRSRGHGHERP